MWNLVSLTVGTSPMLKGRGFRGESRVPGTCGDFTVDAWGQINTGGCH